MKLLVWNIRGFNHPLKQKEVVSRIKRIKVYFVCLLETRVKKNKMKGIMDKWFHGWKVLHNYSYARNGRIWMLWKDDFQVSLIASNDQSITVNVEYDSKRFFFTAIYGCNEGMERRRLWSHLDSI